MKHLTFCIVASLIFCFLLSGCVSVDQQTLDTLNRAIDALNAQPLAWKEVLNDSIKQLGATGKDVAREVDTLLKDAAAFVGAEARCEVDFFRTRLKEALEYIRDKFKHDKFNGPMPPPPAGWVCHFNPDHLELEATGPGLWRAKDPLVNVTGFNFTYAGLPTIELRDNNNQVVRSSTVNPAYQTAYQIQLNVQPEDFQGIQPGGRLVLKWQDYSDPNALSVVLPPPPSQAITLISNPSAWFHTPEDSDKDHDTSLSIHLYGSLGDEVANVEGIRGYFVEKSDMGPFLLQPVNPQIPKDQILAGTTKLEIKTEGDDEWKFNYRLTLDFSDNTHFECNFNNKILDQDAKTGSYPLAGSCEGKP